MLLGWAVIAAALLYLGLLFALAAYGDRARPSWMSGWGRPYIYAFAIAVYCTSWTFFGSVGLAAVSGLDFLAIYIGPILAFTFGSPLLMRIASIAKAQNITSIADFISARYGKSQLLAVVISLALLIGAVPYIALQLKAISISVATVFEGYGASSGMIVDVDQVALWGAFVLAVFASMFGTRFIDATEHQSGLMLAIAAESFIKLLALLAVGAFVTWGIFGGLEDLVSQARAHNLLGPFEQLPKLSVWTTFIVLSFSCAFLLPRQFHVTIVENLSEKDLRYAALLVPAYMIGINIFIVPMTIAGTIMFAGGTVSPDTYVLNLPMSANSTFMTMAAFIGGLSAATAMVIVESIALSIMVSNNIVVPLLLRGREGGFGDMRRILLPVRRVSILIVLLLGYAFYQFAGTAGLAQTGLLAFAAVAQLSPAFFGGLFWKRGTAPGALLSILVGLAIWAYTLLIPSMMHGDLISATLEDALFGVDWLQPTALFGISIDPFVHGVFWSLLLNICAYIFGSLLFAPSAMERLQANTFVGRGPTSMGQSLLGWHTPVRLGELQSAVARYLGEERTRQAFDQFAAVRKVRLSPFDAADIHHLRYAEHLLTSVIGTSSRMVLSMLLRGGPTTKKDALRLLDEASLAVQYTRDILQTAIDHARHGITVYDSDLNIVCWNHEYMRLFNIPDNFLRIGKPIDEILRFNAERGLYGPGATDEIIAERIQHTFERQRVSRSTLHPSGRVVEIRADDMPGGGVVVTFTDVTEAVATERALEERVNERTHELMQAKAEAEQANSSKTRFLAAASHDILQPLNAARLYVASLSERSAADPNRDLVANVDASLQSVEEIFSVLLDISRMDAGAYTPDIRVFPLADLFRQIEVEFTPMARNQKIDLSFVATSLWVRSDRQLLRRLLQNLISNAIKYTPAGRVLVGVRRAGDGRLRIEVWDTGLGIPLASQRAVFKEFQRLHAGDHEAHGLGLGLSIVERIGRILHHKVTLQSRPGHGSMFAVTLPEAQPQTQLKSRIVPAGAPLSALTGTRALCIDNEAAILDGMRQLLEGWGCHVMTAQDLEDARTITGEEGAPDVVIVDYHLDNMDGLSIMRALREALGDLPGILVTANREPIVRENARALGMQILHKPLRPGALRALLAQLRATRPAAE